MANKPHVCTYCGEAIDKGEQYTRWYSVEDSWFTNKMHLECYESVRERTGEDGDHEYTAYTGERPK